MTEKDRLDLAQWAMDYARKKGADQVAISLSNSRQIEIEFRNKQLDKVKESTQSSLNLNVYVQQRYSGHSTNDLRKDALKKFIDEAVIGTKFLTRDEYRSLPDPKYYPGESRLDLNLCDTSYDSIDSSERVKMAAAIEQAAMAQSDNIISTTSSYQDGYFENVLIHSNGFSGATESTSFGAGAEVTVNDPAGSRPEDYYYARARFHRELLAPELIGKKAAMGALQKIGQKKIASGKYDIIVENRTGGRLIGLLIYPMTANALQQKRSFLDGMLDKKIAAATFTMIDDPTIVRGFGSRNFDGEGLAVQRRVMIDQGLLRQYYIDNYYGKKLGMAPNSGSTTNLIFKYGNRGQEDLLKDVTKGILVTGFIGGNSNSTTGDFSFGVVGHLIENGEPVHPINEMNISGNSRELFHQLVELGNDPYPYSSWRIPTMWFEEVQFSGL